MPSDNVKQNLDLILNAQSDYILFFDSSTQLIEANQQFHNNFAIKDNAFFSLFTTSDKKNIERVLREGGEFTTRIETQNRKRWIKWSRIAGPPTSILKGVDKSDYHRLLEELNEARREKDEHKKIEDVLLAKINHELRTPLNAIIGYSQVLLRAKCLSEKEIDHAERIRHNGRKLLMQIDNALSFSKEMRALDIEELNLFGLIQSVVDEFKFCACESKVHFSLPSEKSLTFDADFIGMRQVLRNLVDNAIKFSKSGEIKFRVKSDEGRLLEIHVVDEGPGIESEGENIFEPFSPIAGVNSILVNDCGIGLGLSSSRKICEKMGFKLEFDRSGKGSTFTIVLDSF